jgi:5'-3' exonuclease
MAVRDARVDRVIICTPDKDLGQCVGWGDGKVWQWDRRQDKWFDAAGVHARLGVPPASVPDLLALVGDTADGFPGLPGWGAKSAAAVLARYERLERIPKLAMEWDVLVRGALRLATTLAEQYEHALLFRRLATLRSDAPIDVDVQGLWWRGPRPEFAAWAERLGAPALQARAAALAARR